MSNGNGTWVRVSLWLAAVVLGLVSFVACAAAGVVWARLEKQQATIEANSGRINSIERKLDVIDYRVRDVADGVRRLEERAGTLPSLARGE